MSTKFVSLKHGSPKPPVLPPMGQGGTIWVNFEGDVTPTWWGTYHPGTTPPAKLTEEQKTLIITMLQSAFDGVADVDDNTTRPAIKIIFTRSPLQVTFGRSFEIVVGGNGSWTPGGSGYSGFGGVGGWFSSAEFARDNGKCFVFPENFGNDPLAIKGACLHELVHAFGVVETYWDGSYYSDIMPLNATKWTPMQWATFSDNLGHY